MAPTITTTLRQDGLVHFHKIRVVLVLWVASVLVFWPATTALVGAWMEPSDRTYRHGFLIAAVCLWLIREAADEFAAAVARPSRLALVLLIGATFAWVLFWRAAIQDLFLLITPVIVLLAVAAVAGWRAARTMTFPIGFIYFAEPAWGSLAAPLARVTATAVTGVLNIAGIAASRSDTLISIPEGKFHVDLGCSGVHYVIVGLALAALIGAFERASMRRRVFLLAVMLALAVLANWLRVGAIVVAGHLTNMQHWLITRDHYWFGWGLFVILTAAFVWFAARTERPAPAVPVAPEPAIGNKSIVTALVALGCFPVLGYAGAALDAGSKAVVAAPQPADTSWSGPYSPGDSDWKPNFAGADEVRVRSFVDRSGRTVEVMVAAYRRQRQGVELVNYANSLEGERLSVLDEKIVNAGSEGFIETRVADARGHESIIWSRYDIGGVRFVEPLASQLWYGLRALGGSPLSSLDARRATCQPDCTIARATLERFAAGSAAGEQPK
ncbi:MAG: exosortase C-terminal domain/associated protein EpsI [Gammaproteobacteria bacterium]